MPSDSKQVLHTSVVRFSKARLAERQLFNASWMMANRASCERTVQERIVYMSTYSSARERTLYNSSISSAFERSVPAHVVARTQREGKTGRLTRGDLRLVILYWGRGNPAVRQGKAASGQERGQRLRVRKWIFCKSGTWSTSKRSLSARTIGQEFNWPTTKAGFWLSRPLPYVRKGMNVVQLRYLVGFRTFARFLLTRLARTALRQRKMASDHDRTFVNKPCAIPVFGWLSYVRLLLVRFTRIQHFY